MTPEQKEAERVIELFWKQIYYDAVPVNWNEKLEDGKENLMLKQAKACAAIHCRGVIDVLKKLNPEYEENTYWHPIDHWIKVFELLNK